MNIAVKINNKQGTGFSEPAWICRELQDSDGPLLDGETLMTIDAFELWCKLPEQLELLGQKSAEAEQIKLSEVESEKETKIQFYESLGLTRGQAEAIYLSKQDK
jgi:hypothetical protein